MSGREPAAVASTHDGLDGLVTANIVESEPAVGAGQGATRWWQ